LPFSSSGNGQTGTIMTTSLPWITWEKPRVGRL